MSTTVEYFEPSVARARECRTAMDEALWASVRDLLGEPVVAGGSVENTLDNCGPTDLLDYAAYFDLELTPPALAEVPAKAKAKATSHLKRRLSTVETLEPQTAPPRITNFSTKSYSAEQLDSMRRWWDTEPANRLALTCADDDEFARSSEMINLALSNLRNAAPELYDEVEIIVRDIVLSKPDGTGLFLYSGASSFALWGAVTMNVDTHVEWPQCYRQIVHEAGHNLLFGIARDEPLVLDDPSDRRASPIRVDARPMDGIFHAAFVSAREAFALEALLRRHEATGGLSADEATLVREMLDISVLAFWDCSEILHSEAQLTELGKSVLADCESYMTANFAVQ